jgi:hypothetical protein
MVGIEKEKQKEIEPKIRAYLQSPKAPRRTWTELLRMAENDKISKATLSRCLRKLELKGNIIRREVDATHYPPRTYYSLNRVFITPPMKNPPCLAPILTIKEWNKALQTYAKKTRNLHLPRRRDESGSPLFMSVLGMMIEILLFHIWASAFREDRLDDAVEYLRGQMTTMVEQHIQYQAKNFVHYAMQTRKDLLEASEAFISHTQATAVGSLSQDEYAEQVRPHLQFRPTMR